MIKKVAVGMSGGVDSTITALLLKNKGYEVVGLTMAIYSGSIKPEPGAKNACYGPDEAEDLEKVAALCERLGIKHYSIDLKQQYKHDVLDYFCSQYMAGKTPNPCAVCNRKVKFGGLVRAAKQTGIDFDYFATGHYARCGQVENSGRFYIKKGAHRPKDQSYFLWGLGQDILSMLLLPLGELQKTQVRALAREACLPEVAEKADSQDFIDSRYYSSLFEGQPSRPGPVLDMKGETIGEHKGIIYYTIGQRKGLGIGGAKDPLYVVDINAEKNAVILGPRSALMHRTLEAGGMNWVSIAAPEKEMRVQARIRQQHMEAPATAFPLPDNRCRIVFDDAQLSITPGQSVVLYDGDTLLGGGVIESRS